MAPKVQALLETALYVSDLTRSIAFYRSILGLPLLGEFDAERGAALAVGNSVLLLFRAAETTRGNHMPAHGTVGAGHIAFEIAAADRLEWKLWLATGGVQIEAELSFGHHPSSIYFRDPDGNLLELAVRAIWPYAR